MTPADAPPVAFVLLKVAVASEEDLAPTFARKRAELERVGVSFWSYGGRALLPRAHVQPFARTLDAPAWAALVPVPGPAAASQGSASAFSADGRSWATPPRGVLMEAAEHALVFDAIERVDWRIDLAHHAIAAGPAEGAPAAEHLRFRVDKACLRRAAQAGAEEGPTLRATVALRLREPYGVTVRG